MDSLTTVLVPICICVILPIAIVLIVSLASINKANKQAEVLIKAIEANNSIDAEKIADSLRKPKKSPREILNQRLLRGSVFSALGLGFFILRLSGSIHDRDILDMVILALVVCLAVGAGYLVTYFVTRNTIDK